MHPPMICVECKGQFHAKCTDTMKSFNFLLGDDFFHYECKRCTKSGVDVVRRFVLSWYRHIQSLLIQLNRIQA